MNKISKNMIPAMQGVIPSTMATSSKEGIPNITYVSQVYFIDETRVGLSWQFMNKSWKNIIENPVITVILTHPETIQMWELHLRFTELTMGGTLFDEMDMQLYALSKMFTQTDNFKLKAVIICEITDVIILSDGIHIPT